MCCGGSGGISKAQVTPQALTVTTNATTFNCGGKVLKNATVAHNGTTLALTVSNTVTGGYYSILVTKNTASNLTITPNSGSMVVNAGAGIIVLSGASGSVHLINFRNFGGVLYFDYGQTYTAA